MNHTIIIAYEKSIKPRQKKKLRASDFTDKVKSDGSREERGNEYSVDDAITKAGLSSNVRVQVERVEVESEIGELENVLTTQVVVHGAFATKLEGIFARKLSESFWQSEKEFDSVAQNIHVEKIERDASTLVDVLKNHIDTGLAGGVFKEIEALLHKDARHMVSHIPRSGDSVAYVLANKARVSGLSFVWHTEMPLFMSDVVITNFRSNY
ncbi:hypothetical protein Scep_015161 [Stephania cephalantha]|uniref:RNase H type-1 domain-containing protein n=1 Tax=Stephania cephalantha TaxID=152367 RepID=A0AAP0J440_9MAGN